MIQVVIGLNIAIALFGFYVAWRIWRVRQALAGFAVMLAAWERHTHWALNPDRTPDLILRGQQATASLRERYGRLEAQLQQFRRILALALLGLRLLRSGGRRRRRLLRLR
ncbi:MAG: hypothetical protein F6J95_006720 [Leptolyngbya sp. SIO1E4]|nr:hypothetical protein [Leptolyngbya sp. SIO1E4]